MNNKHLSWYKEINNNFIIASRAYFLHIPHQKFCFYHLPTRGRAGIKLGDAWYISNLYISLYGSMLLYYLSWMFYMHLYAILYDFRDSPINLEPIPSFCFFLVLDYRRKGKPNGVQLTWNFMELIFGQEEGQEVEELGQKSLGLPTRVGARPPPWARPLPRGQLRDPPTYSFLLYIPTYRR